MYLGILDFHCEANVEAEITRQSYSICVACMKDPMMVAIPVVRGTTIAFPSWRTASRLFTYAWLISTILSAVFLRNMIM